MSKQLEAVEATPTNALLRMVDFRIPLVYLLSGFLLTASILISMYYQLQSVSESLKSLQIVVQSGNQSWSTLASEQALLKFRLGSLEDDVKQLKATVAVLQSRK